MTGWAPSISGTLRRTEALFRWYNVKRYGARGNGSTDDTTAIQAAVTSACNNGGGTVYFPYGVYVTSAALTYPLVSITAACVPLTLRGPLRPPFSYNFVGSTTMSTAGAIVKNTASGIVAPATSGTFSNVYASVRDLGFRSSDNPAYGALDFAWAGFLDLARVSIDTNTATTSQTVSTHTGIFGLRTPTNNNSAHTKVRDLFVTGYDIGLDVGEHTDADGLFLAQNRIGMQFETAYHNSRFGRVCLCHNKYGLNWNGQHCTTIDNLDIEHTSSTWATTYDINDPSNNGYGLINHWLITGGTGYDSTGFLLNGGANLGIRNLYQNKGSRYQFRWHRDAIATAGTAIGLGSLNASQTFGHWCNPAAAANGDTWTHGLHLDAGTYTLRMLGVTASDCGNCAISLNNVSQGSVNWYTASTTFNVYKTVTLTVPYSGWHVLKGVTSVGTGGGYIVPITTLSVYPSSY